MNRRRALTALAVGVVAPGALASCFGGSDKQSEDAAPAAPSVAFTPDNAAADVLPTAPVGLQVRDGWFQRVTLTNADGKVVAGVLSRDRTAFNTTEPLGYGVEYTWGGSVVGRDGKAVPVQGAFTTITPTNEVSGQFQLADGQVVGVAAPIILQFDASISDKASVERALTVTTDPPVEGSWAWLPDEAEGSRVHWRTREYFPAGTKVHVDARLYGVPFGDGAYGAADSTLAFEIGRRQLVKAEASSHRIQVITDAGVIMDFPCSYGEGDLDAQRHPQRRPRGEREVRRLLHDQPGGRLRQPAGAVRGADLQQRRVHPRQPGQLRCAGQHQRHQRLHQPVAGRRPAVLQQRHLRRPGRSHRYSIQLSYADGDIWDWAIGWDEWVSMSALSAQPSPSEIPSTAPVTPSGAPQPVNGRPGG